MSIFDTVKSFLGKKPDSIPEPPVPQPTDEITIPIVISRGVLDMASAIVDSVERDNPHGSPENKHAVAFARLLRASPSTSKRDASILIELALRR